MKSVLLSAAIALLVLSESSGQSEVKIMPSELLEYAEWNGCSQVSDFYEKRPGPVNPPFVYGYLEGSEEDSAVFWCETKNAYFLMFKFKKSEHELAKCPYKIEWDGHVGGLSLYRDKNATLKDFVYLKDAKRKVLENVRLSHNAIRSYYDGLEHLLYCYKGEWLIRFRH
jgi:hypothetical protein